MSVRERMGWWHRCRRWAREWWQDWFFPDRFDRVRILPEVIEDIRVMARGSQPNEMVAFLTGSVDHGVVHRGGQNDSRRERVLTIDGLYVKGYYANKHSTSFSTYDVPLTNVYGTVHSHPSTSNRPSRADQRLFNSHGWFHLIICRPYRREDIAVYNKYGAPLDTVEF